MDFSLSEASGTHNAQISLMLCVETTLIAGEALMQMTNESTLTCTRLVALWTQDWQVAVFLVLMELGLAGKDASAAVTSEVIAIVVYLQCSSIRPIEVASYLQTVFVGCDTRQYIWLSKR